MQEKTKVKAEWQEAVARYASPDVRSGIWQVVNTLGPYFALWYLMVRSLEISYWLTLLLAIPTSGFMVRAFIIFHDCGHASFFKSRWANDTVGVITGLINFMAFYRWRREHAMHHATAGNLDRRGVGDVYTMTVQEYLDAPWWRKLGYRAFRNPIIMFLLGPAFVFVVAQRFPLPGQGRKEAANVWWTDVALLVIVGGLCWLIGWQTYLLVQMPLMIIGGGVGVWMFYVQHNFNPTYWVRQDKWDFAEAGLEGSSFYRLPAVLQWFTGNIGFHHIHHLSPKIPNYKLPACYRDNEIFHIKALTLRSSLRCLGLRLWDEQRNLMVGWNALKLYRASARPSTIP